MSQPGFSLTLDAVLSGQPVTFSDRQVPSAIANRRPVIGPVEVTSTGLAGDAVGDPSVHGGADKALHHFPRDHYADFAIQDPSLAPLLTAPGAFGENLCGLGLTEAAVCIGDVIAWGPTVRLQVSHGRAPCWKLNARFGVRDMLARLLEGMRIGWYYRVITAGTASAEDPLILLDRLHPDWTVARMAQLILIDRKDREGLMQAAELPALAQAWRQSASASLARLQA